MKRGDYLIFVFGIVFAILLMASVSAVGVTLTAKNLTYAVIDVSSATNLYGYEVSFDYTGTIGSPTFSNFMIPDSASTSNGHSERGSVSSVYESRLDSAKAGVSGSGNIFNLTHSGSLSLRYAVFVYNDSTNSTIYYNLSAETSLTTTSGGGGGSATGAKKVENISIDLRYIDLNMELSSNTEKSIIVTNRGTGNKTIKITQQSLDGLVILPFDSVTIGAGESKSLKFLFLSPSKAGIYAGKLIIGGNEVYVSINAGKKEVLFDVSVLILDADKTIKSGNDLNAQISLIPMADNPRLDVTLSYLIKDFEGKTYLQESETLLIDGPKNLQKRFRAKNLPSGEYLLGVEVVYSNGTAVSSAHFNVASRVINFINIAIFIGIVAVFVLILAVYRIRKAKAEKRAIRAIKNGKK